MKKVPPLKTPCGLTEIIATFGDIYEHVTHEPAGNLVLSPEFESKYIVAARPPFSLPLARGQKICVSTIRCHRLLKPRIEAAFNMLLDQGLRDHIHAFGGCFHFRQKRNGAGLSAHCWGIALDLNCDTNQPGTDGDMSAEIVTIFKDFGFVWGGDWKTNKDPMHFQFCSGY